MASWIWDALRRLDKGDLAGTVTEIKVSDDAGSHRTDVFAAVAKMGWTRVQVLGGTQCHVYMI